MMISKSPMVSSTKALINISLALVEFFFFFLPIALPTFVCYVTPFSVYCQWFLEKFSKNLFVFCIKNRGNPFAIAPFSSPYYQAAALVMIKSTFSGI